MTADEQIEALTATLDDEKAAHSETLSLWHAAQAQATDLERKLQAALDALEPFASYAAMVAKDHPGWDHDAFQTPLAGNPNFRMAAFRRALAIVVAAKSPAKSPENESRIAREA